MWRRSLQRRAIAWRCGCSWVTPCSLPVSAWDGHAKAIVPVSAAVRSLSHESLHACNGHASLPSPRCASLQIVTMTLALIDCLGACSGGGVGRGRAGGQPGRAHPRRQRDAPPGAGGPGLGPRAPRLTSSPSFAPSWPRCLPLFSPIVAAFLRMRNSLSRLLFSACCALDEGRAAPHVGSADT